MEERSIDVFLPSSDNPDQKRRKKSGGDRSYRADRRPLPDKTCARVPFASPLSGQVKGPGQGRVPFLASFDRCQGLRIDDHADYHSLLSRKGLRFFFPLFCAKNVTRRNLVRPGKMITGARREFGLVRCAFENGFEGGEGGRGRNAAVFEQKRTY